ncbi:MAG: DUF1592 domain-containing protein [Myxococcota bacterium]
MAVAALLSVPALACTSEEKASKEPLAQQDLSCPAEEIAPTPLRRLTRFEYANSVRDVFGIDVPTEDLFPRDEQALGFDNQAGTLSLTDLHVQGYLDAADVVSNWLNQNASRLQAVAGCELSGSECARTLVSRVGQKLVRRALSEAEIDSLLELYGDDFGEAGFREGASRVVSVLLQHPEFVYRVERDVDANSAARVLASPWVLASRLSFLVWGAGPDETLLAAAANGALVTRVDVEREARRLLADPRARRGVLHFYIQWLDLSSFDEVEKDPRLFKFWDESLRTDMQSETARFLEAVLWEDDGRFETLLTAPYTFANAALADFYGLPLTNTSSELLKTPLPDARQRSGLLTQASILSRQAKANQSDPIHRGKFIRERFFCAPPPPPPPDLVVTPPKLDPRKTTRERFAEHRASQACAGCHDLLDPVGFLFEHYDAVGRFRETEADAPIDASGFLKATDVAGAIDGVPQLASELAKSKQVRSCLIEQWFHYAFARGESTLDACTLSKLEEAFERSNGNLVELLVALTQTDPFLYVSPAPEPEQEQEP